MIIDISSKVESMKRQIDMVEVDSQTYQNKKKELFEFGCCIYPTAPFTTPEKLKLAYQYIQDTKSDTVITICEYASSIWRAYKMTGKKSVIKQLKIILSQ